MRRQWPLLASALVLVPACGTRTGLWTPSYDDVGSDAGDSGATGGTGGTGGTGTTGGTGGSGATPVTCEGSSWSTSFGSEESLESGTSVAVDDDCNVIATGIVRGTTDLGGGTVAGGGVYLVKYAASGQHLWSNLLGDASGNLPADVAVDEDGNVVLVGHLWEPMDLGGGTLTSAGAWDVFVAKYRADGSHVWSKRFGDGEYQHATSVAIDSEGNIVVAGYFAGELDFGGSAMTGAGLYDAFVAKLDADGDHVWGLRIGDEESQDDTVVAVAPDDGVWVAGRFRGSVDLGGGALQSEGGRDVYIARLNGDGSHVASRAFGGAGPQVVYDMTLVPGMDQAVLVGAFQDQLGFGPVVVQSAGENDAFVMAVDGSLEARWVQTFGDDADQTAESVATGPSGMVAVAGSFEGTVSFDGEGHDSNGKRDLFVALLAPDGAVVTGSALGDDLVDRSPAVAVDPTGAVVLTGAFEGGLSWDPPPQPLQSAGDTDAFLIRREGSVFGVPAPDGR